MIYYPKHLFQLERVVVITYLNARADIDLAAALPAECNATFFPDFVGDESGTVPEMVFEQVSWCDQDLCCWSSVVHRKERHPFL